MRACAFISRSFRLIFLFAIAFAFAPSRLVLAVEPPPPVSADPTFVDEGAGASRTQQPEEDDFRETPYTSFGEFNDEEETEDMRFFQHGRFFGVSLGLGYEGAMGNRGALYTGGLPALEVRVHYWFDFNFALTLGVYSAKHQYTGTRDGVDPAEKNDFSLFKYGAELRYYFDTRDATAPVTFAGPFLLAGIGNYSKSESSVTSPGAVARDNAMGLSFGGGLEFPLKPRKSYLNLEAKFHSVSFNDTGLPVLTAGGTTVPDTSGLFFTVLASILFTY